MIWLLLVQRIISTFLAAYPGIVRMVHQNEIKAALSRPHDTLSTIYLFYCQFVPSIVITCRSDPSDLHHFKQSTFQGFGNSRIMWAFWNDKLEISIMDT